MTSIVQSHMALITEYAAAEVRGDSVTAKRLLSAIETNISAITSSQEEALQAMCARIQAADDAAADGDYMLDANDCIRVLRGTWRGPLANDCPPNPRPGEAA